MHASEGEHQVQLNAGSHGGHLHADGRAKGKARAPHSIKSLSSTDSLVGFNEVGFAKHIHVDQMYPQVPFSVWISELIFSRAKHTHPFTFTDSCKLRQISETLAGV